MKEPIRFEIGKTVVDVWPSRRYLETIFEDGTKVPACPQDTDEYRKTAMDTGYGTNTWALSLEHELIHSLLSGGRSWTLWSVAHDHIGLAPDIVAQEEKRVMEFQKKLNAARKVIDELCSGDSEQKPGESPAVRVFDLSE